MSPAVVYLPQALDDIDEAFIQYERQRPGLGGRFASALQERLARIQTNPDLHGAI